MPSLVFVACGFVSITFFILCFANLPIVSANNKIPGKVNYPAKRIYPEVQDKVKPLNNSPGNNSRITTFKKTPVKPLPKTRANSAPNVRKLQPKVMAKSLPGAPLNSPIKSFPKPVETRNLVKVFSSLPVKNPANSAAGNPFAVPKMPKNSPKLQPLLGKVIVRKLAKNRKTVDRPNKATLKVPLNKVVAVKMNPPLFDATNDVFYLYNSSFREETAGFYANGTACVTETSYCFGDGMCSWYEICKRVDCVKFCYRRTGSEWLQVGRYPRNEGRLPTTAESKGDSI